MHEPFFINEKVQKKAFVHPILLTLFFLLAHKYTISTHTGDIRGAGTDANVYITLFSKDGNSAEMKLNDSKNNFERKK